MVPYLALQLKAVAMSHGLVTRGSDLAAPPGWELVAYLCGGWPEEEHADPELVRHGWQERTAAGRAILVR
jgi:hypothetical protein